MLYYSHINEDNRLECNLLQEYAYETVVGIAGSGERLLALMDQPSVKRIFAIDTNEEALFLLELKLVALRELNIQAYLSFTGAQPEHRPSIRIDTYTALRACLSPKTVNYWDARTGNIEKGILTIGHFECFLARIRPILRAILGKSFYQNVPIHLGSSLQHKWFFFRWNILRTIFGLRWMYILFGNLDEAFIASDAEVRRIPDGLHQLLIEGNLSDSYITHLIFEGHLRNLPEEINCPSMQPAFLQRVSRRLKEGSIDISYLYGDWRNVCKEYNLLQIPHTFYSLSDILSFESKNYLLKFLTEVFAQHGQMKTVVIRSFLRNVLTEDDIGQLGRRFPHIRTKDISTLDSSNMYQVLGLFQQPAL